MLCNFCQSKCTFQSLDGFICSVVTVSAPIKSFKICFIRKHWQIIEFYEIFYKIATNPTAFLIKKIHLIYILSYRHTCIHTLYTKYLESFWLTVHMRCTHHWMCFSRLNRAKFVYWRDSWNHFDNELTLNRHLFVNIREHRVWCIYIHNRFRLQHCNEHIPAKHFFIPYCHCEITSETFHAILINYYEINLSIF